jgi:hypothetical protein
MTHFQSIHGQRPARARVRTNILLGALACACLVSISGCSGTATVDGTVSYGGPPVEYGSISFEPKDGKQKTVVATIVDGKFEANEVAAGPTTIRICVGERPKGAAGSLMHSAPSGHQTEISKSEKNMSGGAQTLNLKLKAG